MVKMNTRNLLLYILIKQREEGEPLTFTTTAAAAAIGLKFHPKHEKTTIKRKITNFTCDNWVPEYFGSMSEGSATKYVAVVGGGLVEEKKVE